MSRTAVVRAFAGAHGVTVSSLVVALLSWPVVVVAASIAIPLKYPSGFEQPVMDSAVVVALVVPLTATGRMLDDRVALIAESCPRRMWPARTLWLLGYLAVVSLLAVGSGQLLTPVVSWPLIWADACLLGACAVLSGVALGGALTWVAPLSLVLLASAPGIVPIGWNLLYLPSLAERTFAVAAALWAVALCAYAWLGANGRRRSLG